MPRRVVDPETGFIKFISTPDEKAIRELVKSNEALKEENKSLREALEAFEQRLNNAGI